MWAEWYRALAERALPPGMWLPSDLWRIQVQIDDLADLTTAEQLAAVGLGPPLPGRATWPLYQQVGEQLAAEGFTGLVAPSASRPKGGVLCLFHGAEKSGSVRTSGRPRRIDEPPVPPRGLRT